MDYMNNADGQVQWLWCEPWTGHSLDLQFEQICDDADLHNTMINLIWHKALVLFAAMLISGIDRLASQGALTAIDEAWPRAD